MDRLYLGKKASRLLNIKHSIKNTNHSFIKSNKLFLEEKGIYGNWWSPLR